MKRAPFDLGLKAVLHFKRIVAFRSVFFCVNIIKAHTHTGRDSATRRDFCMVCVGLKFYTSAHATKKYATFRYDTGEVENRLKVAPYSYHVIAYSPVHRGPLFARFVRYDNETYQ